MWGRTLTLEMDRNCSNSIDFLKDNQCNAKSGSFVLSSLIFRRVISFSLTLPWLELSASGKVDPFMFTVDLSLSYLF